MPRRPKESLLERLARETSGHVLLESTRAAIEKMAEEFARDALSDPEFRAEMRRETKAAVRELLAKLAEQKASRPTASSPRT
jgi:hypothetical protein